MERLRVLADTSRVFSEVVLDYERLLETIAERISQHVAETCVIQLTTEDGLFLEMAAVRSQDPRMETVMRELFGQGQRIPVGPGSIVGSVAASGKPVFLPLTSVDQVANLVHPATLPLVREVGISAILEIPLIARGRVLGVLVLTRHGAPGRALAEEDKQLAEDLTDRAALAIDNARLFRESEQRLRELEDREHRLAEALRARDEFLSIASHELRTPLTPLQLQLESLARAVGGDALHKKVEVAIRQTGRLAQLVETLLDVSRISTGRFKLQLVPCDLCEIVRDVVERHADEAAHARCAVAVDVPERAGGQWDRMKIDQVLVNLLSNALKYAPGTPITVGVALAEGAAVLRVIDRGIGIAPEDLGRIFERFERAVPSRNYGGLGLGLYIARQICQAHGGRIEVESARGAGSTFTVTLPR